MTHPYRTHDCGALTLEDVGKDVTLSGWVSRIRDHGGLLFIDLRDRFGITQLVVNPEEGNLVLAQELGSEWVITGKGKVIARTIDQINPALATGTIEVQVKELKVLSRAKTPPFPVCEPDKNINEELSLKHRHLDIRRGRVGHALVQRHKAMQTIRSILDRHRFLEITTPILTKSTPEGARDYVVPSRLHPGEFYALAQSPQLYKQLLMMAGMDRYFQIAICFRDESLRADRQAEFSQIDIEMSFGQQEELIPIVEELLQGMFQQCAAKTIPQSFQRMSYKEALDHYGSDRPDLRFGLKHHRIDDIAAASSFTVFLDQLKGGGIVKAFSVPQGGLLPRRVIDEYITFVQSLGLQGLAWMKKQEGQLTSNIAKFFISKQLDELVERLQISDGDLLLMGAGEASSVHKALDHLRRKIGKELQLIPEEALAFVWITDFPLFLWNEELGRVDSAHHPFTAPHPEDWPLLETNPLAMRSLAYDVVLNGYELGGGIGAHRDKKGTRSYLSLFRIISFRDRRKIWVFSLCIRVRSPASFRDCLGVGSDYDAYPWGGKHP
jgi:aspartyl-tRNA synthetase